MTGIIESVGAIIPTPKYEYITTEDGARTAMSYLDKFPIHSIDTEATALDPYEARLTLLQIGVQDKVFVFDIRSDTEHSSLDLEVLDPILKDSSKTRILQNASYDMKLIKRSRGYYLSNVYDTMLAEQLSYLGLGFTKASLDALVFKYLGLQMPKETRNTFADYYQIYQPFQLDYAAKDVVPLQMIRDLQWSRIQKESLENVAELEFKFLVPLCEMELNGVCIDKEKWRIMMSEVEKERIQVKSIIQDILSVTQAQTTLFDVSTINISSNLQLKKALNKYGINIDSTSAEVLQKHAGLPVIDAILDYRKAEKLVSTYSETLLNKINKVTGRLHTDFKQLVSTGRMSSSNPNLQNIPKKQRFRSCFIAQDGNSLITADMSGAELRILGNLSQDPAFIDAYATGQDLHTRTASDVFGIPYDEVQKNHRTAAKAINFGLVYGMSPKGLSKRLKISEKDAEIMINGYFKVYSGVKRYLDNSGKDAIRNRYSVSISGRRRYYSMPPFDHPDRKKIQGSIERQGKNMPIQGCLSFDTVVKGVGLIGSQVDKTFNIETGCGKDTARGVFSGEKSLMLLKLSNGIELKITKDHKIPTISRKANMEVIKDKAVEELTKDDLLLIPLNKVEGIETDLSGYKYTKGHWRETYVEYKYPNKMNAELAFIIGCLIGDGSYTKHNHFRFVCPTNQHELFDKFNSFVYNQFGYKPIEKLDLKRGSTTPLPFSQVSSVVIRGFLKHIGLDYVVHEDKSIPEYFYTETLENRGALLNGLFSTDGGVTANSEPNFTTISKKLAFGVHQLLFSMGINSNLKTHLQKERTVYRLQIHNRFCKEFYKLIGFSVKVKSAKLRKIINNNRSSFNDGSVVPEFIPKSIYEILNKHPKIINKFTSNQKSHLRRFMLGSCSYNSWRKFFKEMPNCFEKDTISKYLQFDFCFVKSLSKLEVSQAYDISCDNIHYFTANGVMVHNSNADTIKEAMCLVVERLKNYDARLILTVHDEVIVECKEEQKYEVAKVVEKSIVEGFGKYFSKIPMETDALIGPCWLKSSCESPIGHKKCGGSEMKFVPNKKFGTKLVCSKCGSEQD